MVVATDALGDRLHTLEATVLAVSTMAEEAGARLAENMEGHKSDQQSDWGLLGDQDFQMLKSRVSGLEPTDPTVTAADGQELQRDGCRLGDPIRNAEKGE